ncbi:MAG: cation:proton antiporter family protein [Pseudomonadales bacterium]|jgi:Kef-type K+ transport system membrane component KefB|nr:cation:proton antiporter family protein [Pseudomonadales bacterium]
MADTLAGYVFYEFAALLVLAAGVGFLGLLLRQPLIVSFIGVGILAGPSGLAIARSESHIDLLAELGIAVLLFLVGLKLDLKLVRTLGPVALFTGLGQVLFTTAFGYLIGLGLGLDDVTAIYVAVALTFSSTIIIVKLLSDKREIDSLHGRIALGFLIVQDLVVVLAMILLSALAAGDGSAAPGAAIARIALAGAATLVGVLIFVRFLATPLVTRLARAPELLVSFAIGWAALLAAVGHFLGFGKELGGLLAGVCLASTPFREAIAARMAALRDFLLLFFFIALGAALDLAVLGEEVGPALLFSLFVLVGNPLIVLLIMRAMGYGTRTGFLAGLTVAQISEFSLIFMTMGVSIGHVDDSALGLVTLVGLITIAASTYMITWSHPLHRLLAPLLARIGPAEGAREAAAAPVPTTEGAVLLFGLGRYGRAIAADLAERGVRVLAVDFDPLALESAAEAGLDALYGDATDPEFLAHLPLHDVSWALCAMPVQTGGLTHDDGRLSVVRALRDHGFEGRIAVTSLGGEDEVAMREAGADLVLQPFRDAAARAAQLVATGAVASGEFPTDPLGQKELAA